MPQDASGAAPFEVVWMPAEWEHTKPPGSAWPHEKKPIGPENPRHFSGLCGNMFALLYVSNELSPRPE